MKKNLKNWLALGLILLTIGAFILVIALSSDFSQSNTPPTPVDPVDPKPPAHTHKWQYTHDDEYHWQYTTCTEHDRIETTHVKHDYDNDDDATCNDSTCGYVRTIPTKPEKLDVTVNDGEASIGKVDDSIADVVIPSTVPDGQGGSVPVTSIGDEAFKGNLTLTTIKILDGVKKIGKDAFAGCASLKRIEIPKTVTEIDPAAFSGCQSLERIIVDGENSVYMSYTDCLIRKADKTIILGCKSSKIPTDAADAVAIGAGAFQGSFITEIAIPQNITSIGADAFSGCAELVSFSCAESVTELPANIFKDCLKLETVTLHDKITRIGEGAFSGCASLKKFDVPAGVENIYSLTFSGCIALTEVTFPQGFRNIGNSAFSGCSSLTAVTLPSSLEGIGLSAFKDCVKLTQIIYKGTEAEWENVQKQGNNWKPEETEIVFSPETEPTEPDTTTPDPNESESGANDNDLPDNWN